MNPIQNKIFIFKLLKHDRAAFEKMYDLYIDKVYRFIYFKVNSIHDAEDITSEVFLKAWEYFGRPDVMVKKLQPFLYQIARNRVIDFYRKRALHEVVPLEPLEKKQRGEEQFVHSNLQGPHRLPRVLAQVQAATQVEQYLSTLKDEYKEVIVLKHLEGYSIREIAEILEKQRGAVRVLLHRAMKTLGERVQQDEEVTKTRKS